MRLSTWDHKENPEPSGEALLAGLLGGSSLLLVGPRGVGKTRALGLVREALCGVGPRVRFASLFGDERRVGSLFELLLQVLRELQARHTPQNISEKVERLYEAHREAPGGALLAAKEALLACAEGAPLVLLCDDLDLLLRGLEDEEQRQWAELMRSQPGWSILGSAPALVGGSFDGFFVARELAPLGALGAWSWLRERAAREQHAVATFLETPEARAWVAAVHHLLGGAHRVIDALYDGLRRAGPEELFGPLLDALGALALEHEARLVALSPMQRKLVALLCEEARPVTVKRVAERCLCSHQSTAKQLGELALLGFLQKTPVRREVYCELLSPALRLYLAAKYQRTAYLRGCLTFLQRWFFEGASSPEVSLEWPLPSPPERDMERALQAAARLVDEQGAEGDFFALASAQWSAGKTRAGLRTLIRGLIFHNSEGLFRLLGSSPFSPEAVLIELDSMSEFAKRSSRLWELRGALLIKLGRFEEAIQNSEQLLATNPEQRALSWLQAQALLGAGSQPEALRLLAELLATRSASQREAVEGLSELILQEAARRGAEAAALLGVSLRALLEAQRGQLAGGVFTRVLHALLQRGALSGEGWSAAITAWREAYAGLDECSIPLQMMQAANRYLSTRDPAVLLALPIEQRSLLLGVGLSVSEPRLTEG